MWLSHRAGCTASASCLTPAGEHAHTCRGSRPAHLHPLEALLQQKYSRAVLMGLGLQQRTTRHHRTAAKLLLLAARSFASSQQSQHESDPAGNGAGDQPPGGPEHPNQKSGARTGIDDANGSRGGSNPTHLGGSSGGGGNGSGQPPTASAGGGGGGAFGAFLLQAMVLLALVFGVARLVGAPASDGPADDDVVSAQSAKKGFGSRIRGTFGTGRKIR